MITKRVESYVVVWHIRVDFLWLQCGSKSGNAPIWAQGGAWVIPDRYWVTHEKIWWSFHDYDGLNTWRNDILIRMPFIFYSSKNVSSMMKYCTYIYSKLQSCTKSSKCAIIWWQCKWTDVERYERCNSCTKAMEFKNQVWKGWWLLTKHTAETHLRDLYFLFIVEVIVILQRSITSISTTQNLQGQIFGICNTEHHPFFLRNSIP